MSAAPEIKVSCPVPHACRPSFVWNRRTDLRGAELSCATFPERPFLNIPEEGGTAPVDGGGGMDRVVERPGGIVPEVLRSIEVGT